MNNRLFVGNLSYTATQAELAAELTALSLAPSEVKIVTDRETGNGRGFAFVSFKTAEEADAAIPIISGYIFHGRPLRADYATERPKGGSGPTGPSGPRPGAGRSDGGGKKPGGGGRGGGDWGDSGGGRRGRGGRGDDY